MSPWADDIERVERALGWRPTAFRRAALSRGESETAARWIASDGRRSAFIKIGATDLTAGWVRDEHENYMTLRGPFLPAVLGFDDDGHRPTLAIEDLSACSWPPPWNASRVGAVLEALAEIRATTPPPHLHSKVIQWGTNWADVARKPDEFLALGLCSTLWFDKHIDTLLDAAGRAPIAGTSLIHMDIRSDNLCFRGDRAIVIDWNHAAIANADLDVAAWLPSLHAEGGPTPEAILPDAPELAAWFAGFFGSRAGAPAILDAPHVRPLQREQLTTALPWAARALSLPPP